MAKVEGNEVVIRVNFSAFFLAADHLGLVVEDVDLLAAHFARELNAEDVDEEPFINKFLDAALLRCADNDDSGISFEEQSDG